MSSEHFPPPKNKAAERLAVIVDAAERAALSVIDDAEKEAKRYLQEAQSRADRIVAERLREAADRLESQGLDAEELRLRSVDVEPEPTSQPEPEPTSQPDPDAAGEAERAPAQKLEPQAPPEAPPVNPPPVRSLAAEPTGGSAAARLLATQMAVSGSSRKEIEMRLKNGFEIEDTSEILDAILGSEE